MSKADKRTEIIDAAEQIFFKYGLEKASMSVIADKAGISKGGLYMYFNSKEDLYHAIVNRAYLLLKEQFDRALSAPKNGLNDVKALAGGLIAFSMRNPDYFRAMTFYENEQLHLDTIEPEAEKCTELYSKVIKLFDRALEKGVKDGSISSHVLPQETAYVLWSQIMGVLQMLRNKQQLLIRQQNITQENLMASYFVLIENALRARVAD